MQYTFYNCHFLFQKCAVPEIKAGSHPDMDYYTRFDLIEIFAGLFVHF